VTEWTRSATQAVTAILAGAVLAQLVAAPNLILPWLLVMAVVWFLVEMLLEVVAGPLRNAEFSAPPMQALSAVLWLSAAAIPRPLHALLCVGCVLMLRSMPRTWIRAIAGVVAAALVAMAWISPPALLASWGVAELARASVLYRGGAVLTALPFVLFALSRGAR